MSKAPRKDSSAERSRNHEKKIRRLSKSPCSRPPSAPDNLSQTFDRDEGGKGGNRLRLRLKWDEVTTDTEGNSTRIRVYKVELYYSTDSDGPWFLVDRYAVPGKDDTDDNSMAQKIVKGVKGRLWYRFRVRGVDTDKCKSDWSAYSDSDIANDETPPAPQNVRIYDNTVQSVALDWDDVADPNDSDRRRDDQTYFSAELSNDVNFNAIYKRERHISHTRWHVRIPDADTGNIFYGRVWSDNDTGDKVYKSLKIPGRLNGNSNPNATADFVFIADATPGSCDPGEIRKHAGPLKAAWSRCSGGSPTIDEGAPRLNCDGCSYETAKYPALFAEIGYIYGGSGANFNVPDLRHRKSTGASSDAELGDSDTLTLSNRSEDHNVHGPHKQHGSHNKHGNHATHGGHGAHDGHNKHGSHSTHGAHGSHGNHDKHKTDNVAEATHGHQVGSFGTSSAGVGSASGGTGTPTDLTRIGHGHTVPIHSTNSGAAHAHQHNVGHDNTANTIGHQQHTEHGSHTEHSSGEHDSSPNVQGHNDHGTHAAHNEHGNGSGEHDADGTKGHTDHVPHDDNEHDYDKPGNKGHKGHGHQKHHYIVCA